MRIVGLVLLGGAAWGCAPALSSFTPAHVAPKGHAQAEFGIDGSIPTGTVVRTVNAGDAMVSLAKQRPLSAAEQKQLFDAAEALLLDPPSVTPHVGVAYSIVDNLELDGRYSIGAFRVGMRYQFLDQKRHGVDMSAGAGVGRYLYEFPVGQALEFITIDDFERWQFDLPLLVGGHDDYHRWWAGPRLMATVFDTAVRYDSPPYPGFPPSKVLISYEGHSFLAGAQFGAAFGYKKVFFGPELTLAELWLKSELRTVGGTTLPVNLASFIIYPGIALMGEF